MLTDTQIKKARPQDKTYKLYDADGLYLVVRPSGGKNWLFRYQLDKKRKDKFLGQYPATTLQEARANVANARLELMKGNDPFVKKQSNMLFSEVVKFFAQKISTPKLSGSGQIKQNNTF